MIELKRFLSIAAVALACVAAGCSAPQEAAHDHGDDEHGHDHAADHHDDHEEEGGHHHAAPHGGTLIALGDHTGHAEVVFDDASETLTVYFLDGEAESPIRLEQETVTVAFTWDGGDIEYALPAVENVLTGETAGDTSQFEGPAAELKGVESAEGTLKNLSFRGLEFDEVVFSYPEGEE